MMWLHMATGFTGALTLVFLARAVYRAIADAPSVAAYFSPKGGCTDAVVRELKRARKEILILARAFSSEPLAKALLDAKLRGVRVELLFDRRNEKDSTSDLHLFAQQGLAPLLDMQSTSAHNSVILIDSRVLLTGSFDFTRQAEEEHADNLLVVGGYPEVVAAYRKTFLQLKTHGQEFRSGAPAKPPAETVAQDAPVRLAA
ncbi:MAG TPA: phospholipase D-like domain-containing protein [Gemmataceae bacterium]|nr:phospholipase D-like domain-containing protein [Gemmataceae bacterium]